MDCATRKYEDMKIFEKKNDEKCATCNFSDSVSVFACDPRTLLRLYDTVG